MLIFLFLRSSKSNILSSGDEQTNALLQIFWEMKVFLYQGCHWVYHSLALTYAM